MSRAIPVKCPKCGTRLSVIDSRHADSAVHAMSTALVAWAREAVGWYTQDWVARRRICQRKRGGCGSSYESVEILREDAPHLLRPPEAEDDV